MSMTLERPTTVRPDVVQQSTRDAVDELYAGDTVAAFRAIDAATLAALGIRGRRKGHPQEADDRFRGSSVAAAMGAGVLAAVGLLNGVPSILRAVLSIDSETAGAINASIIAAWLAVIAVCSIVIVRRGRSG